MAKASPCIPCDYCQGQGHVPLPAHLTATLAALRLASRRRSGATVFQVHAQVSEDITPNATNNRLRILTRLGLATRTRQGREWLYHIAKP